MLYFNNRYDNLAYSNPQQPQYYSNDRFPSQAQSVNLNISYQNFIVEDKLAAQKKKYGQDLLEQIREKEQKKMKELEAKKEEEMKEDLRLKKENERFNRLPQSQNVFTLQTDQLKKDTELSSAVKVKHTPLYRSYLNAESLNPFMEIINAKKVEQDSYNSEIIDKMKSMYDQYSLKIKEIEDHIKNIRLMNFHNNMYKVDLVKELSEVKGELAAKRYQENFKRDAVYKAFINSKRSKQDMNEFFAINQSKLPIINLSNHIICPGMRLNSKAYYHLHNNSMEVRPDITALNEALITSYKKADRLDRYNKEYLF